jgi:REP element-mobilizing transposase RayT
MRKCRVEDMARKLRLEYPGAVYHVINRGNYRQWIFEEEGARNAFEECLFKACVRSEWLLHAYVIMGNHYHLAVETPKGNLVLGMQWLQATYANRFNRFRKESGHLFQGRYKALAIEPGAGLGRVCHYIHLNPVRAGITDVESLRSYRHGSYWYLWQKRKRPGFLEVETALNDAGGLPDEKRGWESYAQYLEFQARSGSVGKNDNYESLSSGWAIGSKEFKRGLIQEHKELELSRAWESKGVMEARHEAWAAELELSLKCLNPGNMDASGKSAPWKVAAAAHMKRKTDASNSWLAESLGMGGGAYVSKLVCDLWRGKKGEAWKTLQKLGDYE